MPSSVSLYFRQQVLLRVFLNRPSPTVAYLGLTTSLPLANVPGTGLSEPPAVRGYARARYDLVEANWELNGVAEVVSTQEIPFSDPTADWGLIQGWALCTAVTGGEVIISGRLSVAQRINFGATVVVPPRALSVAFGDAGA